jgi:hypothetical protein
MSIALPYYLGFLAGISNFNFIFVQNHKSAVSCQTQMPRPRWDGKRGPFGGSPTGLANTSIHRLAQLTPTAWALRNL